jgi:hypothetical protein
LPRISASSGTAARFSTNGDHARHEVDACQVPGEIARDPVLQEQYVRRVTRASDHLVAKGYITTADRKDLVESAQREPLPLHR